MVFCFVSSGLMTSSSYSLPFSLCLSLWEWIPCCWCGWIQHMCVSPFLSVTSFQLAKVSHRLLWPLFLTGCLTPTWLILCQSSHPLLFLGLWLSMEHLFCAGVQLWCAPACLSRHLSRYLFWDPVPRSCFFTVEWLSVPCVRLLSSGFPSPWTERCLFHVCSPPFWLLLASGAFLPFQCQAVQFVFAAFLTEWLFAHGFIFLITIQIPCCWDMTKRENIYQVFKQKALIL